MEVKKIRKNSKGLQGTYANIDHHAKGAKKLVDFLVSVIPTLNFSKWVQGHNVHVLERIDGFKLEFRPFYSKFSEEWGIEIRNRISRTDRPVIYQFIDYEKRSDVYTLLNILSVPTRTNNYGDSTREENNR